MQVNHQQFYNRKENKLVSGVVHVGSNILTATKLLLQTVN